MFDAGELPEMLQTAGYGGRIHRAAGNAQPRSFRCPNRQIVGFNCAPGRWCFGNVRSGSNFFLTIVRLCRADLTAVMQSMRFVQVFLKNGRYEEQERKANDQPCFFHFGSAPGRSERPAIKAAAGCALRAEGYGSFESTGEGPGVRRCGSRRRQSLNNYRLKPVGWVATESRLKESVAHALLRAASALCRRPSHSRKTVSRRVSTRHVENVRYMNSQAKVKPAQS